jgi:acyl carrier protein
MTQEELTAAVREIVARRLVVDPAEVTDDARFMDDLGGDSVDMVELLMELQQRFSVRIPDADFQRFTRFGYTVRYLAEKLGVQT